MSESLLYDPLSNVGPGSAYEDELRKALVRRQQYVLGNVPTGVGAAITPVGQTETGETTYGAPGLLNMVYSGIGRGVQALTNLALKSAAGEATAYTAPYTGGEQVQAPQIEIPGIKAAEQKLEEQERAAANVQAKIAPPPKPETPEDVADARTGVMLGESAVPIPGAVYAKLPALVAAPLKLLAPTAKEAPFVGMASTGLATALQEPAAEQERKQAQAAPDTINLQQPDVINLNAKAQPDTIDLQKPAQDQSSWTLPEALGAGGLGLVALWAGMKGGPRLLNRVIDAVHGVKTDPAMVSRIYDDIARGGTYVPPVTGGDIPQMPLPGNVGATTRWAQRNLNPNAVLNEVSKGISSTADEADALIARNNMVNYPAGTTRQMESQFRTGVSPSGSVGPSQYAAKVMVDGMTDDQRQLASQAAWMRNELDNRNMNGGQRVNFPQYDNTTLHSLVNQANNDPQIALYLNHVSTMNQFIADDMAKMGMITKEQADAAKRLNPNFMPTYDMEGNLRHSWSGRNVQPGTGFDTPPMPAWTANADYYDKMYRQAQHNAFARDWIMKLDQYGKANPEYRGLVHELTTPTGEPVEGSLKNHVTIQTSSGPRTYAVNNTDLLDSLKNPTHMGLNLARVNAARRLYQNTVTGPLALLSGTAFSVKNLIRDTLSIPLQAKPGAYTGYLSRATGGRLPIYDPTFIAGSLGTAARDVGSVTAKTIADALTDSNHPLTKALMAGPGRSAVENIRNWMNQRYLNSNLEHRIQQGVGGGGSLGAHEMGTRLVGRSANQGVTRDPIANQVAPLLARPNLERIASKVPLGKGTVSSFLNLRQLVHEIHGAISDAPHSFYYDLNRDNPKFFDRGRLNQQRLASEVQQVIGDPGTRGAKPGYLSSMTPYFNTGLQAVASTGRAFRDHPLRFAGAGASAALMYSLAEQLSALSSGDEHTKHLEQRVSNGQREANITLYHGPGTDPNDHTEINLPQEHRLLKPIFDEITSAVLGTYRAHQSEPLKDRLIHGLADLFSHHVSTNLGTKEGLAAADVGGFGVQPPLPASIAAAAMGGDVRDPARTIVQNLQAGRPLTQSMLSVDDKKGPPGQEGTSNYIAAKDGSYIRTLLGSILGTVGDAAGKYGGEAESRWRQTHDVNWLWEGLKSDIGQNAADQNRYGNFVWRTNMAESTRGAADERISRAVDNLKDVQSAAGDTKNLGFTRSGGQRMLVTGNQPGPDPSDKTMTRAYHVAGQFAQQMNSKMMPQINDLYKQMDSIKNSAYTADEKRRMTNELAAQLAEKRQQFSGELDKLNAALSHITGRHVDISRRINWRGGVEQFPEN